MKKTIAFFDFDGTITTHDTLLEIIKFYKGDFKFYLGFALNSPYIAAWKTGFISNHAAKEKMLKHFFGKTPLTEFQQRCDEFAANCIPLLIRPKALQEIEKLKAAGAEIVVVSASAENWLQAWCSKNGLALIGTKLVVRNGRLTGRIDCINCHGEEKVNRINEVYDLSAYDEIYCYGDSNGDKPMLKLGTHSFYKPFR